MKEIFLVGAGGMIGSISRMIILKLNIYYYVRLDISL